MGLVLSSPDCPPFAVGMALVVALKVEIQNEVKRMRINNPTQSSELSEADIIYAYFLHKCMHK